MTTFNPDLPVQTRDGRPARIICTDRKGESPIVALVGEGIYTYLPNGKVYHKLDDRMDLFNIKTDHDRRVEVAYDIMRKSAYSESAIIRTLEHINWPACSERP